MAFTHHLNPYGFLDRQWRVRLRSHLESRIFVIGDSFVEGFMVEADATIPRVMEREATAAGVLAEVMNLGIRSSFPRSHAGHCGHGKRILETV